MPTAAHMDGQKRSQHRQRKHGGGAVHTQPPHFERVRALAEFAVYMDEIVKQQPEQTAREQRDAACINPTPMTARQAHLSARLLHGAHLYRRHLSATS